MQAFEFYCPTKIYFGKGAEARVGEAVKHFGGTKVFRLRRPQRREERAYRAHRADAHRRRA